MKIWTILICSYNCADTIAQTLESIPFDGNEDDIDVFVVDDGSTQDIKKVVQPFIDAHPKSLHYFRKENGNQGSCINFGIKKANSRYLSLLDSDDTFNKQDCQKVIEQLKKTDNDTDLVLLNFNMVFVNKNNKIVKNYISNNSSKKIVYKDFKHLSLHKIITIHSSIYSVKLLKQINPVIENCGYSDNVLYYEVLLRANKIAYLNKKIFLYNYFIWGPKQAIYLKTSIRKFDDMLKVYDYFLAIPLKDFPKDRTRSAKKIIGNHFYWLMAVLSQNYNYTKTEKCKKIKEIYKQFVDFEIKNNAQNKVIPFIAKFFRKSKYGGVKFVGSLYQWFPINFLKATRLSKQDKKEVKALLAKANKK